MARPNRERVYQFVRERLLAGRPPTVREVQAELGFRAVESARAHLAALVEEGRLEKTPGAARGYRLPGTAADGSATHRSSPRLVPLLGGVPAGDPVTAVEEVEGYLPVLGRGIGRGTVRDSGRDSGRTTGHELFALRVCGESMRGAGILDGDVVIVRRQGRADSGDIVVALVGEEATVKRLRVTNKRVELHPENPLFDVIVPDPTEFTLLGRVIEVRRSLDGPLEVL
jgi:repressor LexA